MTLNIFVFSVNSVLFEISALYLYCLHYAFGRQKIIFASLVQTGWVLLATSSLRKKQMAIEEWQSSNKAEGPINNSLMAYLPSFARFGKL